MNTFWEGFAKYVGVRGIIALVLVGAYVAAFLIGTTLPEGYSEIMSAIIGLFLGKNGNNYIEKAKTTFSSSV